MNKINRNKQINWAIKETNFYEVKNNDEFLIP